MAGGDRGSETRAVVERSFVDSYAPALPGTIARSLSALPNLSSTLPAVAALRGCSLYVLQKLAEDLRDRGKLDLSEAFIDASFSSAKKGALVSALQNAGKAAKSWQSADRHGLPVAVHVASA